MATEAVPFLVRRSSSDEPPDWSQIAALYGELARLTGSSVVELNRAVAIAEAGKVEAALALVERLELDRYHYLHATHAELLRRLDRVEDARAAYDRALELVHSDAERRFLEQRNWRSSKHTVNGPPRTVRPTPSTRRRIEWERSL
jgi:predicted RNA polymerase sigma factor